VQRSCFYKGTTKTLYFSQHILLSFAYFESISLGNFKHQLISVDSKTSFIPSVHDTEA